MSACLAALPPELLSHVVASIRSPSTLCNLARCSRQLHFCTIRHLYRHVEIHEIPERRNGRLRTLAALLIQRPDLAGLVRHFTLQTAEPSEEKAECSGEPAEPEDRVSPELVKVDRPVVTAANASSLSTEEKISGLGQFRPTHVSYYDLILALLLPALLKVEKMVLDLDPWYYTSYLEQTMARAARREKPFDTQPPFEALTVFVHSHNKFPPPRIGFIGSLLKLPAIHKISGCFEELWDDDDIEELDSSSSSLTILNLSMKGISKANLGHILRAPKALKAFFYRVCYPVCVNFTDIRHALGPQENCLESIDLSCDRDCGINFELLGSMTSFINFNTLKVFKTVALFFAAIDNVNGSETHSLIDIFPRSLETIHLTHFHPCFKSLVEALGNLLAHNSPQQVPSLKKLVLDKTHCFDPTLGGGYSARSIELTNVLVRSMHDTAMERLRRVAAARGVLINVIEELTDENSLVGGWEQTEELTDEDSLA